MLGQKYFAILSTATSAVLLRIKNVRHRKTSTDLFPEVSLGLWFK